MFLMKLSVKKLNSCLVVALNRTPGEILRESDRLLSCLASQGVEISEEKNIPPGENLMALGILSAIIASGK